MKARTLDTEILHLAHKEPCQKTRADERPHRLSDLCAEERERVRDQQLYEDGLVANGRGWATCGDRGSSL